MSQCSYVSNGTMCRFPGAFSEATRGEGRWRCALHFRCADMAEGAEIVERSLKWDALPNKAEEWVRMRRREVCGSGDNPYVAKLRAQIEARAAGEAVGIASSRVFRQPGADEGEEC